MGCTIPIYAVTGNASFIEALRMHASAAGAGAGVGGTYGDGCSGVGASGLHLPLSGGDAGCSDVSERPVTDRDPGAALSGAADAAGAIPLTPGPLYQSSDPAGGEPSAGTGAAVAAASASPRRAPTTAWGAAAPPSARGSRVGGDAAAARGFTGAIAKPFDQRTLQGVLAHVVSVCGLPLPGEA
jgi:hypothetical protein